MPGLRGHALKAAALLLLALSATSTYAEVITKTIGGTSSSSIGPVTCPSRSINYITHSLPQQCLTTSWASKPKPQETTTDHTLGKPNATSETTENATIASPSPQANSSSSINTSDPIITIGLREASHAPSPSTTTVQPETTVQAEQDPESPLDNANFLSFEEWKRQNLAKVGQSAENLGTRAGNAGSEHRRRPGGITNALDAIGEDAEIEIDFGGFVNPDPSLPNVSSAKSHTESDKSTTDKGNGVADTLEEPSGARRRSKDAGKTCKERSNYASFDCAATVLKTNPECKGSNAVLVENKDSYMLNTCSAKNKFFIVELCDDILIDTIVLANFEFFSSMFRTFRVSVSDRYPVKLDKWRELGTFEARNSREVQAFLVENPLIWARYLRIEFLTHFGNEYYCPVSLVRVHGTTMMEEFNHDLKRSGTEEESENEAGESEEGEGIDAVEDVVSADALKEQGAKTIPEAAEGASKQVTTTSTVTLIEGAPSNTSADTTKATPSSDSQQTASDGFSPHNSSVSRGIVEMLSTLDARNAVCAPNEKPTDIASVPPLSSRIERSTTASDGVITLAVPSSNQTPSPQAPAETNTDASKLQAHTAPVVPAVSNVGLSLNISESARSANQTSASTAKLPTSPTQPPNASPTTQESFFKSVHKRLQLLESNSTLSLQYIEEQSRILRDAFSKVEKRQLAKTTTFLETLNTTVLNELRDFRTQYDQIWQSTVLELSSQREQSQDEVFALSTRLGLLADEIVFQKRMAIVQFILILLCLGLVIFSRHGSSSNTYLELPPVLQNAMNRSSTSFSRYGTQFETPPASPSSTRPSSRYGLFPTFTQRRSPSNDSARDKSPSIGYSPPTPTSQNSAESRDGKTDEDPSAGGLKANEGAARQTESSQTTPYGDREEGSDYSTEASLELKTKKQSHISNDDVR
ncbi:hypothetical protein N7G274_008784 [Stereocaulon virgatum]|uniref:SUN domain-containing protein n=1 Tax=Stereocaulon virgatum TaxID=373712 RepID=A0ABR4A061_9LECA